MSVKYGKCINIEPMPNMPLWDLRIILLFLLPCRMLKRRDKRKCHHPQKSNCVVILWWSSIKCMSWQLINIKMITFIRWLWVYCLNASLFAMIIRIYIKKFLLIKIFINNGSIVRYKIIHLMQPFVVYTGPYNRRLCCSNRFD